MALFDHQTEVITAWAAAYLIAVHRFVKRSGKSLDYLRCCLIAEDGVEGITALDICSYDRIVWENSVFLYFLNKSTEALRVGYSAVTVNMVDQFFNVNIQRAGANDSQKIGDMLK